MNTKAATQGFCIALLSSLTAVACGPSKFSGSSRILKTPEVVTPVTGDQSPKTPVANTITITESFTQLRPSNSGSDQDYGVGLLSLTASGLLQGQKIISVERTGMSSDFQFVQCQKTADPVEGTPKDVTQTFSQTMNCFLIFKGLSTPKPLHRLYPGIERVARIGSPDAQNNYSSTAALCIVPEDDLDAPCSEKDGRTVLKDIVAGKSVADMGYETLPFPDAATIEADLKTLPK
jgi:hypothetical protein